MWKLMVHPLLLALLMPVLGQGQMHDFAGPKLRTDKAAEDLNAVKDPLANYGGEKGRHEAAIAAFQAAYDAASGRPLDRSIRLFLISLHRELMPKSLYDLGVVCARDYRFEDAINFQREAQQQTESPEIAKLAAEELERLETIVVLEGSPSGQQQREFDTRFMLILGNTKNPIAALQELKSLEEKYKTRWEAPALAGILYTDVHKFPESLKSFEAAAVLAPPDRRKHLQEAAEVARHEATFNEQRISADELWDKKQYESAAQHYASAWENSPGRLEIGMLAATGFLMADRVNLAVEMLSRMSALAGGDMAARITAMLKELGAVYPEAARAAKAPAGSGASAAQDTQAHVRTLVGLLSSRQMELAAKPDPALVADKTNIPHVPDDELTSQQASLPLVSTEHVYETYKHDRPPAATPPAAEPAANPAVAAPSKDASLAPAKPTMPASLLPPSPPSVAQVTAPPEPARGGTEIRHVRGELQVPVTGDPAGAVVVFDSLDYLTCTTPCDIPLGPGRHTWKANLDGYREALGVYKLEGRKPSPVNVSLLEKAGIVYVESNIPGQPVFVNGARTDKLTPCRLKLREGAYKIALELDGKMVTQDVDVKDEGQSKIKF